jgi:nucleotide-binding universal stress UspA family protein
VYEHLLVALDGSPTAERVLAHAEALAKAFQSTVTLFRATVAAETLMVAESSAGGQSIGDVGPMIDPTPILEAERTEAVRYLNSVADRLKGHGLTVHTEHFDGPPADEIVDRARALGVSLILMTTHGRSGLGRVVFGNVADAVLRHAPCPVLLVRVTSADEKVDLTSAATV